MMGFIRSPQSDPVPTEGNLQPIPMPPALLSHWLMPGHNSFSPSQCLQLFCLIYLYQAIVTPVSWWGHNSFSLSQCILAFCLIYLYQAIIAPVSWWTSPRCRQTRLVAKGQSYKNCFFWAWQINVKCHSMHNHSNTKTRMITFFHALSPAHWPSRLCSIRNIIQTLDGTQSSTLALWTLFN